MLNRNGGQYLFNKLLLSFFFSLFKIDFLKSQKFSLSLSYHAIYGEREKRKVRNRDREKSERICWTELSKNIPNAYAFIILSHTHISTISYTHHTLPNNNESNREPKTKRYHKSLRCPVMAFTCDTGAGPIANTVCVPLSI